MRKFINYFGKKPLDFKVFCISCFLILGFFFFPDEPKHINIFITYIIFIFLSLAISGFYMTYIDDPQYNFFRRVSNVKQGFTTISIYIMICIMISYVLAITKWFLFLIG